MPELLPKTRIVVIDDDRQLLPLIKESLDSDSVETSTASTSSAGLAAVQELRPDIVILDLHLPEVEGFSLLKQILDIDPRIEVVLLTGDYSTDSAVQAIQNGAADYVTKPFTPTTLRERLARFIEDTSRRRRAETLQEEQIELFNCEGLVGRSPAMLDLFSRMRRIAPHFETVLLHGETGTGKELVANALYRLCPRHQKPFVVANCAAVTETLLESELFGYSKGAFTGAHQDKIGIFEHANGGVVFLDEVGELSMPAQAKLLRVLQNGEVQRVGSPTPRRVNLITIAATNRDLKKLATQGLFREDLYFRLSMVTLSLPPLRERQEDIPLLQKHFLNEFSKKYGKQVTSVSRRAQALLSRYGWPGNVRELRNIIGNACMMNQTGTLDLVDLPPNLDSASLRDSPSIGSLAEVERLHVRRVMDHVKGNKAAAADILGISRATLYRLLEAE